MHTAMTTTPLYTAAFDFLQSHQGEHLAPDQHLLVTRCINKIIDAAGVSYDTAKDATLQACGELSARGRREYIDCSRTTSYALFVVGQDGKRTAYTIAELLRMIEQSKTSI
jgi:hypothetical protein